MISPERVTKSTGVYDDGSLWHSASRGLRTPWLSHMVGRFTQLHDELRAVLSNGDLLVTSLTTLTWRKVLTDVKDITALAALAS